MKNSTRPQRRRYSRPKPPTTKVKACETNIVSPTLFSLDAYIKPEKPLSHYEDDGLFDPNWESLAPPRNDLTLNDSRANAQFLGGIESEADNQTPPRNNLTLNDSRANAQFLGGIESEGLEFGAKKMSQPSHPDSGRVADKSQNRAGSFFQALPPDNQTPPRNNLTLNDSRANAQFLGGIQSEGLEFGAKKMSQPSHPDSGRVADKSQNRAGSFFQALPPDNQTPPRNDLTLNDSRANAQFLGGTESEGLEFGAKKMSQPSHPDSGRVADKSQNRAGSFFQALPPDNQTPPRNDLTLNDSRANAQFLGGIQSEGLEFGAKKMSQPSHPDSGRVADKSQNRAGSFFQALPPDNQIDISSRRRKGLGTGYIEIRTVIKNEKKYQEAHYHYEVWNHGNCLIKTSKYIRKRVLRQVERMEAEKVPVQRILEFLGVKI